MHAVCAGLCPMCDRVLIYNRHGIGVWTHDYSLGLDANLIILMGGGGILSE